MKIVEREKDAESRVSSCQGQTTAAIRRSEPAEQSPTPWRPTRLERAVTGQFPAVERDALNAHAESLAAELTSQQGGGYPPWLARRIALHDALALRLLTAAHGTMSKQYLSLSLAHQRHLVDLLELGRRITASGGAVVNIRANHANVGVVAGDSR